MEVAPGIHRLEIPMGERIFCMFLLVGSQSALLVDTGLDSMPREYLLPYLVEFGIPPERIRYVVNTHADFDHMSGNASVREIAPGAIFMCHELDLRMIEDVEDMIERRYGEFRAPHGIDESEETKKYIRANSRQVSIDVGLRGGETINLGEGWRVEVLHTPGHSLGHLSIYEPRSHTMIIADAALWNSVLKKDGSPAFPPTYRYVDTYVASIHRLQGMRIDTLLTSHYPVYRGEEVPEFLGESGAFVERVDETLRRSLVESGAPLKMREMIEMTAPLLGRWPPGSEVYLTYPFQGHLERMARYGIVKVAQENGLVSWRWSG